MIGNADKVAIDGWLTGIRKASTVRSYRHNAQDFVMRINKPLNTIDERDVREYIAYLQTHRSVSYSTIAGAVRSFLCYAYKIGIIKMDLGKSIATYHVNRAISTRSLSRKHIAQIISSESSPRNRAILQMCYQEGLKISEISTLKWQNIILIGDEAATLGLTDTNGNTRSLSLSAATWEGLKPLRGNAGAEDPVFRSQKNGHLDTSAIHRVVRAAVIRTGLPKQVSSFWLRHSYALHKMEDGVSINVIQVTLGHTKRSTTSRYAYASK